MVRVTISRRDTADTAITAELLLSLHVQSFSLSEVLSLAGVGMAIDLFVVGCRSDGELEPVVK